MFEKTILLESFEAVKKFVDIAASKDYDIELMSGKYIVNAKSIMGVFSLDLTKPLIVVAHTETPAEFARQIETFSKEHKK
ncbi:MAG: HPr family phosphocarrier protein [Clostridia bacterium]|nr:HPr family phosphocarrier protein [Clostridia bacterium]MBP3705885.1 HPr family phosphocarrier protein [Clostridia bacterium]